MTLWLTRGSQVYNDPKKVLAMHSIVVQSPHLKEFLKQVLAGYPGVTVGLERLEFTGRFEPLIHRWKELNAALDELKVAVKAAAPVVNTPPVADPSSAINTGPVIVSSDIGSKHINGESAREIDQKEMVQEIMER